MRTCEEIVKAGPEGIRQNRDVMIHGVDVLAWVFKGSLTNTVEGKGHLCQNEYLEDLRAEVEGFKLEDVPYAEITEDCFRPDRGVKYRKGETGELDIGRYLAEHPLPFDEAIRAPVMKTALSILLDGQVSYFERDLKDMAPRHAKIYRLAVEAEAAGRPCRVVACMNVADSGLGAFVFHIVIKDWNEPIFPAIWGAYQNNQSANDFLNCLMMYFIGTPQGGNGECLDYDASEYYNEGEVQVIDGRRLTFRPKGGEDEE